MKRDIDEKLETKNIKPTAIRKLVYKAFQQNTKALSLYEIEQQIDNVDRSTIFRTLKTFQDNCLIHGIDDGTGAIKYALCEEDCSCQLPDLHIHFLCSKCGQTHCLKDLPIPEPNLPIGFTFEHANFVIKGTCPYCK